MVLGEVLGYGECWCSEAAWRRSVCRGCTTEECYIGGEEAGTEGREAVALGWKRRVGEHASRRSYVAATRFGHADAWEAGKAWAPA